MMLMREKQRQIFIHVIMLQMPSSAAVDDIFQMILWPINFPILFNQGHEFSSYVCNQMALSCRRSSDLHLNPLCNQGYYFVGNHL